jgi:hypothetical protein
MLGFLVAISNLIVHWGFEKAVLAVGEGLCQARRATAHGAGQRLGGLYNAQILTKRSFIREHSVQLEAKAPSCGRLCLEQMAPQQELHPILFLEDGTSLHV